jgi:hypothetical protein
MPTFAYRLVDDDVMVFLTGQITPSDSDWQGYVQALQAAASVQRERSGRLRFFVFADDGAPNARQRASVVEALGGVPSQTVVITTSMLSRNLITVFSWLGLTVKGFAPTSLDAAAEYLGLSAAQLSQVIEVASTLAPTIGGVSSFDAIQAKPAPEPHA